jgi:hypothetical protein
MVFPPPESNEVNAATLARVFDEVTNSYKFLFFIALLDNAERHLFDANSSLSMDEIILDMLVLAWYPHIYFRLSFGSQDQIAKELDKVAPRIILQEQSVKPWDKSAIRKLIAAISSD